MSKSFFALLAAGASVIASACGEPAADRDVADAANGSSTRYTLTDTARYESMLSEGDLAVLRADGGVIDSVDLLFGVHHVGSDSVLYMRVDSVGRGPAGELLTDVTFLILHTPSGPVRLGETLPHFSDYFSSPAVIDGALYYWMLDRQTGSEYRIGAGRLDFASARLDTLELGRDPVATDFRGYFRPPKRDGDAVAYGYGGGEWRVDPDLSRVLRADARPAP